jgi:hypothetical protein
MRDSELIGPELDELDAVPRAYKQGRIALDDWTIGAASAHGWTAFKVIRYTPAPRCLLFMSYSRPQASILPPVAIMISLRSSFMTVVFPLGKEAKKFN